MYVYIYKKKVFFFNIYIYIRVKSLLSSGRGDSLAYLYSMLCITIHTLNQQFFYFIPTRKAKTRGALNHYHYRVSVRRKIKFYNFLLSLKPAKKLCYHKNLVRKSRIMKKFQKLINKQEFLGTRHWGGRKTITSRFIFYF